MTPATLSLDVARGSSWDAIILGAGPAGSLAARQLAREGARTLLVDKRAFPRDKVCGACLNGRALSVLQSAGLGTLAARHGAIALGSFEVRVRHRATRLTLPAGVALSRARFDSALVAEAIDAGAAFLPGVTASVLPSADDEVRRVLLTSIGPAAEAQARVVLVAAGLSNHCLARETAIRNDVADRSRIGAGCTVPDGPECYAAGTIHMAVSRAGYVGLVRVEDGSLNVAAALEPAIVKSLGAADAAAAVLAEAGFPPVPSIGRATWRGTAGLTRRTHPIAASRLFVLGDAAGYVEPFTGEGIAWALAAGAAVAPLELRACERWEPALERQWAELYRQRIARRQLLCKALALVLRHPSVAGAAFAMLGRMPGLAEPFLRRLNTPSVALEASTL
ncbi:MAG: NAD(P)/FAD-dependent oxidoreductase [Isosphaeraceae bacterium]|nr:NAD(P)/FAD-dependent oxidoreductase [Isosphaeraceae bacterium]